MAKPILFDSYEPPSSDQILRMLRWHYQYFTPRLFGAENVNPQRPALFVGNHCLFGAVDSPLFVSELYRLTGVFPRSLGDFLHWKVPFWADEVSRFGAVPGTPENCSKLMNAGQFVMVFPGGSREVAKRRGEKNRLVWKQRTGFVRMAIKHGYDILPFASVGCDDSADIIYDGDDFKASFIGRHLLKNALVKKALRDGDMFMPLTKGLGPTLLPRPEPFWFSIGKPISTEAYAGQESDHAILWQVREKVAESINTMIYELQQGREASVHKWPLWQQLLTGRRKLLTSSNGAQD